MSCRSHNRRWCLCRDQRGAMLPLLRRRDSGCGQVVSRFLAKTENPHRHPRPVRMGYVGFHASNQTRRFWTKAARVRMYAETTRISPIQQRSFEASESFHVAPRAHPGCRSCLDFRSHSRLPRLPLLRRRLARPFPLIPGISMRVVAFGCTTTCWAARIATRSYSCMVDPA